jgi:hypothetical protein
MSSTSPQTYAHEAQTEQHERSRLRHRSDEIVNVEAAADGREPQIRARGHVPIVVVRSRERASDAEPLQVGYIEWSVFRLAMPTYLGEWSSCKVDPMDLARHPAIQYEAGNDIETGQVGGIVKPHAAHQASITNPRPIAVPCAIAAGAATPVRVVLSPGHIA